MSDARRPRTIAEMSAVIKNFRSEEAHARGLGLTVRPTDVFISTYPKSGTTWLQHVAHGLRSGGSLEFEEISQVVPWLESALDIGIDPEAEQQWQPRLFKAHLDWQQIPKGGRYITAFRNPASVLVSFYEFFEDWFFERGSISLDEFAQEWFLEGTASGTYWDHIVSWWSVIDHADVLALAYEDMVQAPDKVPALVADFLGLTLPDAVLAKVVAQSSREFMAANASKFDEHVLRAKRDPIWGLPTGGTSTKVRTGTQDRPKISVETETRLDAAWSRIVTPRLGFDSYAAFRRALPNPLDVDRMPVSP